MGIEVPRLYTLKDGAKATFEELRSCVTVIAPGVVQLREIPNGTEETLAMFGEFLQEEGAKFPKYVTVVDLTDATMPSPHYRELIVQWMKEQPSVHTCFIQPGFVVFRVGLRFMIGRAGTSISVHSDQAEAIAKARTFL